MLNGKSFSWREGKDAECHVVIYESFLGKKLKQGKNLNLILPRL